jgi:signal transduction histidine kinase
MNDDSPSHGRTPDDASRVLAGGGEAGALARSVDWSKTAIGPVEGWSQALRSAAAMVLHNDFGMLLWWGPEFVQIYNNAYRPVLGDKHPRAMGQPFRECWSEVFHIVGPMAERPYRGGPASVSDDLPLLINRRVPREETHFRLAYSPVPDETVEPTGVGGVLAIVAEISEQAYAERQLRTLRELAARGAAEAKTAQQACATAATTLAENAWDVPFALFYLLDERGQRAHLVARVGFDAAPNAELAPVEIDLSTAQPCPWPVREVAAERRIVTAEIPAQYLEVVPQSPWSEAPRTAIVLPLAAPEQAHVYGVLVCGVSPHRVLDAGYRTFFELVAGQAVTAIRNARAFEEERKRAEALAEIDRAKTTFFSNVSHEFRTPLTLLLGPTEDLLGGVHGELSPPQREQLGILHRNGLRLQKLVNSLLDFARLEAGRIQASYETVDLAGLTRDLVSAFRSAIERAGLTLRVDCPALEAQVFVDRDMWEKIVLNLLSNALKFTFEGRIEVSLHVEGPRREHVVLRVSDTGVGIAEHELPRLFERFHRIEGTRARTHEGSGIGLALVQELARLHGGSVRADSRLGVGTTFTVTIPTGPSHLPADRIGARASAPPTSLGAAPFVEEALRWLPEERSPTPPPMQSPLRSASDTPLPGQAPATILLADDNADMRDYVRRILEQHWTVEAVEDGEKALAVARARTPDLVLTDVMMPALDGFGLLRELRKDDRTKSTPVLMLSARAGEEARLDGLLAGAEDYLIKPFSARELVARVSMHLEVARLRRTLESERDRLSAMLHHQVLARRALETSEARFRAIFEMAEVSLWEEDFSEVKQLVDGWRAEHGDGLRAFLEANPDAVNQAIGLVRIVDVNPATLRMFGAADKQQLLASLHTVFLPESRGVFVDELVAIAEGHALFAAEAALRSLSGKRIDVLLTMGLAASDGSCRRVLVTLVDISAHKLAQRERDARLTEAERALNFSETFVGILGHDLRNPLGAIVTTADVLLRQDANARVTRPLQRIRNSADRMARMIEQILDFTRARIGGGIPLERRSVELQTLATQLVEELEGAAPVPVALNVRGDTRGEWDPDRLGQVLSNLLANAIEHGEPNAPIRVEIDGSAPEAVRIEIWNGGAIPEALQPTLFDPFRRATGSRTVEQAKGLGLGLYIVQQVVLAHGGTIDLQSTASDGTRFLITLPRTQSGEVSRQQPNEQ